MKKIFLAALVFLGAVVFCAAEGIIEEAGKGNEKAETSYAFGMVVASDLLQTGLEINYNSFIRGFREVMEKEKTRYTMEEAMDRIQTAYETSMADLGKRNLAAGEAFLSANGRRPEVTVMSSGLQYELISEGGGEKPGMDDVVLVHYLGATIDGIVFDSTYDSGEPLELPLNRVIRGWSEGLCMMRAGEKAKLYIPPNLAYGEHGAGGAIGPNCTLIFEVELISFQKSSPE